MSEPAFERDLEPGIDSAERAALVRIGERLHASRPVPRASFRGALRRRMLDETVAVQVAPARRIRTLVASWMMSGAALLAVAALGVAHSGPLAPSQEASAQATASIVGH